MAHIALHFKCCHSELDTEQVLDYLHDLKNNQKTPSESFFKHTVYGLRSLYKLLGIVDKHLSLPQIERSKKLPVVLSQEEIKRFLSTPKLLKHRLIIDLLYGCGLRRFELLNIEIQDIDLDRKMLHIRQGKGRKDRYVPLGVLLCERLKRYLEVEQPKRWLFYRKDAQENLLPYSESGVQWVIKTTRKLSSINKAITTHIFLK